MDLQDFVADALLAIARGVAQAQSDPRVGGLVGRPAQTIDQIVGVSEADGSVANIEFDLATTVCNIGGRLTVKVLGQSAIGDANVSRIRFVVPVALPQPPQRSDDAYRRVGRSSLAA